ncbi:hypothetical protein LIER_26237 [Lithospermum erythrorhizon]|uniref:Gag-pol polyprotein n=1 Tax=Lithospermum erythrorhizon TaxID=34254 RepID=A0AAV3RB08_LITER
MSNEKLARKILRTLPKKFAHKVTAIEEAQDIEPTVDDNLDDNSEDEGDITEEQLLEDYKLLYAKWTELTMTYTKVEVER